jgi:ribosomal-protein-alanine N-acetyltransferase
MDVRALTRAEADEIARWRYPGRYATYDVGEVDELGSDRWAVLDGEELIGYCCVGPGARVPGVDEEPGTVDVGYGMRPDLMGRGLGRELVGTILDFVVRERDPERLRLLILTWNERSRKVAEALGFERDGIVPSVEGDFYVMARPV